MRLPVKAAATGRKALAAHYQDTAEVTRDAQAGNVMEPETVYSGIPCHLSIDRSAAYRQGEQTGAADFAYTLRLPPEYEIENGDRLSVTHNGITYEGTAGLPVRGCLSLVVPMTGVVIA